MPIYYLVDGSIYINDVKRLNSETGFNENAIPFIMDSDRSIDIDEWRDLELAELMLKKEKN